MKLQTDGKAFFLLLLTLFGIKGFSQEKNYDFELYGWINPQYFLNSRHTAGARDGLLSLYPLPPHYSEDGKDLNAKANHNFSAATTRIGTRIYLNNIANWEVVGNIEADFTGQSDANIHLLRLRQANVRISRNKIFSLTAGHTWSVFCVPEMMPQMQELNNGTPFHPFSRLNQLRLDYSPVNAINLVGSVGLQKDYASIGIENKRDYKQQSRTLIPEVNLQFQFIKDDIFAGFTGEMKSIQPREEYDDKLTTYAFNAFLNYKTERVNLKLQAIWGENMNDYCLFGGFYSSELNEFPKGYDYKATNVSAVWFEAIFNVGSFMPAIFLGYASHGGKDNQYAKRFGSAMALENVFRIAPRIDFHLSKDFLLCGTVEYTNVKYEDAVCGERLANWRLGLSLLYKFSTK